MSNYLLKIASPDGLLFEKEVAELSLRGSEGDLAVLAGHVPFVTTVRPGDVRIEFEDGSELDALTDGGLLTVKQEETVLLAGSFRWKTDEETKNNTVEEKRI